MLLLILAAVLVLALLGGGTRYGGYYPTGWAPAYGWLPAVLVVLVAVWLLSSGALR